MPDEPNRSEVFKAQVELNEETKKLRKQMSYNSKVQILLTASISFFSLVQILTTTGVL